MNPMFKDEKGDPMNVRAYDYIVWQRDSRDFTLCRWESDTKRTFGSGSPMPNTLTEHFPTMAAKPGELSVEQTSNETLKWFADHGVTLDRRFKDTVSTIEWRVLRVH